MNKTVLKKSLENAERDSKLCSKVVDATFELLSEMVAVDQGLTIEGIGSLGAHRRKGANKELPNEKGELACNNLSIFFHPTSRVKEEANKWVDDVSKN